MLNAMDAVEVHGELILPSVLDPVDIARIVVSVRDVTSMGGPAPVLGRTTLRHVHVDAGLPFRAPFTVVFEPPSKDALCAFRIHADVAGNGQVNVGDFVTDSTTLIDPFSHEDTYTIELKIVSGV
jgi:uncharacterized lipoprotein YbaY